MKTSRRARLGALAATAAAAGFALVGIAGPAHAVSAPGLPDPNLRGSINVYKLKATDQLNTTPPNGTEQDLSALEAAGATPLAGATFKLQQINSVNLTTNAGWASAEQIVNGFNGTANAKSNAAAEAYITSLQDASGTSYSLGTPAGVTDPMTQTTTVADDDHPGADATDGLVQWTNLPLGLYLVEETTAPKGADLSVPFIVTVPFTDPTDNTTWDYDVYAYPKNAPVVVDKSVNDETATTYGTPVDWSINADIPNATTSPDPGIDAYEITDQLDPRLTYDPASATGTSPTTTVTLLDSAGHPVTGTDALTSPDDYTIASGTYSKTAGTAWHVKFTTAGLAKLAAHRDGTVQVVIHTTVNALGTGTTVGDITNIATLFPNASSLAYLPSTDPDYDANVNNPNDPNNPNPSQPVDSNTAVTKWGNYSIQKISSQPVTEDKDGNPITPTTRPLADAQFEVYVSTDPNWTGTDTATSTGTLLSFPSDPTDPTSNPTSTLHTDTNGVLDLEGLRYSYFADNHDLGTVDSSGVFTANPETKDASGNILTNDAALVNYYFLVETVAPQGYEKLAAPWEFVVTSVDGGTVAALTAYDDTNTTAQTALPDVNQQIPDLPSSGNPENPQNPNDGGFPLPFTGGTGVTTIYGIGLVVLISALALGLVARRRRGYEDEYEYDQV